MSSLRAVFSGAAAFVFVTTPFGVAWAADQAEKPDNGGLEEIVVTAQKRAELQQTVPVTVTTFGTAFIDNTAQRDIQAITGLVPNLEIEQSTKGPNAAYISLRGLSFQDVEKSFEPPVGVVLDGVYLSTSTGQLAQTFDFQQIEVLAGPQGTLFGKNTTGGVVNITRTKPDPDADAITGKIRLTFGNFGQNDYEGIVDVPVITNKLALKLGAFSQNDSGTEYNSTLGKDVGKRDYQAFTLGGDWRPTENSDLYLVYDRTNDHSELPPNFSASTATVLPLPITGTLVGPGPLNGRTYRPSDGGDIQCLNPYTNTLPGLATSCTAPVGTVPDSSIEHFIDAGSYSLNAATVNATYDLNAVKLVSVTGFRYSTEDAQNDYAVSPVPLFDTNRPQSYRQLSEEARVETQLSGPFNMVGGVYYFDSDYTLSETEYLDSAALAPIPPGIAPFQTGFYAHQSSQTTALFAQGTYDLTDQIRFILGGRQSWDDKSLLFGLYPFGPATFSGKFYNPPTLGALDPSTVIRSSHSWAQFTPKAGVEYRVTPDLMTYFTYSKGYNAGGYNGRAGDDAAIGPYAPEQVHSYEVGVKSEWFDHKLRVNADAFRMDFNNAQEEIITQGTNAATETVVKNAAGEIIQGVELAVAAKPIEHLVTMLNFGYLDAYYTSFPASLLAVTLPGAGCPAAGCTYALQSDNSKLTPRRSPPFTVGFDADYQMPIGPGQAGANVAVKFVDRQTLDLLNDPRGSVPATAKADFALRYNMIISSVDWEVQAFCKNCTDQRPINNFTTGYQGSFVEFYGRDVGRQYGVSIEAQF